MMGLTFCLPGSCCLKSHLWCCFLKHFLSSESPSQLVRALRSLTSQSGGAAVPKGSPNPPGGWCQQLWAVGFRPPSRSHPEGSPLWQGHPLPGMDAKEVVAVAVPGASLPSGLLERGCTVPLCERPGAHSSATRLLQRCETRRAVPWLLGDRAPPAPQSPCLRCWAGGCFSAGANGAPGLNSSGADETGWLWSRERGSWCRWGEQCSWSCSRFRPCSSSGSARMVP